MAVMEMVTITPIPSNTYTKWYQHRQQHQATANQTRAKPSDSETKQQQHLVTAFQAVTRPTYGKANLQQCQATTTPRDLDNKQPQCLATTRPSTPISCSSKGKAVWAAQMDSGSNGSNAMTMGQPVLVGYFWPHAGTVWNCSSHLAISGGTSCLAGPEMASNN